MEDNHKKQKNDIFKMELHQSLKIMDGLWVYRVSGGWLYESENEGNISLCFVPFNTEFEYKK